MAASFYNSHTNRATLLGLVSLIIWAVAASFAAALHNIPTFEILSIVCFVGFITSIIINTIFKRWSKFKQHPKHLWIIGILGVFGNDVFYILSFKNAPVVQADLINYLWPMMVIIFSSVFLKEKLKLSQIIACFIAFFGIYILLIEGYKIKGFDFKYIKGYSYALTAATLWTMYILVSKKYGKASPELFSIYYGLGMIIALIIHIKYETTLVPTKQEMMLLIFMGGSTHSLAYFCWDYAIKNGDFKFLSILSYASPVISVMSLIICGFAPITIYVLIATICVCIAGIVGGTDWSKKLPLRKNN